METFIRIIANRRGAHIADMRLTYALVNGGGQNGWSLIQWIAIQVILAIKLQIPEFCDEWNELDQILNQ